MATQHHIVLGAPNHDTAKTVVIVGSQRGGTSMVAGTVREMGINLGPRLGLNHEDPQFLRQDVDYIRSMIRERNASLDTWGWKMPHTIDYIDQIEADLRNPHLIVVWRNPLAVAVSQTNRSDADIHTGLAFSANRISAMVEKIQSLQSPILLVNYDQAIKDKEGFIDSVAKFVGVDVSEEMRQNCLGFIDPKAGYKQVSSTFYDVEKVEPHGFQNRCSYKRILRQLELVPDQGYIKATGANPRFVFKIGDKKSLPAEFVLRFKNDTEHGTSLRLFFDFEWMFSRNMSEVLEVEPGVHTYKIITNGKMKRLGVDPTITNGRSELIGVELREA